MKTSKQKIVTEDFENASEKTPDPYAVDFFGVEADSTAEKSADPNRRRKDSVKTGAKILRGSEWSKLLPQIGLQAAAASNKILGLPTQFDEAAEDGLKAVLSGLTRVAKKNITFERLSVSEVNLAAAARNPEAGSHCYLTVGDKLSRRRLLFVVETEFAAALIDLILGGTGQAAEILRPLSSIELTILEFISARILGEINQTDVRYTLREVDNVFTGKFKPDERGGEIVFVLKIGELSGQVTILLPADFLRTPIGSAESVFGSDSADLKFNDLKRIAESFELKIQLGKTRIRGIDLPYLEKDDIILIEKPRRIRHDGMPGDIADEVLTYVGAGTNFGFKGILQNDPTGTDEDAEKYEISVIIDEIISERHIFSQPGREKMETKQEKTDDTNNEPAALAADSNEIRESTSDAPETGDVGAEATDETIDDETLATLENVLVNLRIQIGGRRLSLGELRKIRVGQILDLGCRPSDPVEIVTDQENKPIAAGELILIEEQLGVRLTKIFI
jgi:flagellar motor switch protein FliM